MGFMLFRGQNLFRKWLRWNLMPMFGRRGKLEKGTDFGRTICCLCTSSMRENKYREGNWFQTFDIVHYPCQQSFFHSILHWKNEESNVMQTTHALYSKDIPYQTDIRTRDKPTLLDRWNIILKLIRNRKFHI